MKYVSAFIQILLFGAAVLLAFSSLKPSIDAEPSTTSFSVEKALNHVEAIAEQPHYTGSVGHAVVRNYVVEQLENLGLEPHIQQGFSTTYFNGLSIAVPENIIAKIEGKNPEAPALLLLSHYDSAVHSSYGAADAASGVAAILESVSSFLATGIQPEQDVIILFSDAEEIGLNGANLFVKEHPWAKNLGLVINFEARGSAGPSSMILEINGGNQELIKHFSKAAVSNPFANSLMYSVYKLMPSDTDSTVFREEANTPSIFFAFIDNHFHYHTALDTAENLDISSLNQQGEYALALLKYFATQPIGNLTSKSDYVYFNFPYVGLIYFPAYIALSLIIIGFLGVFVLTFIAIKKRTVRAKYLIKIFFFTLLSLALAFGMGFYGWKLILYLYPQYNLILHGFPYNGATYILVFVCLSIALFFTLFNRLGIKWNTIEVLIISVLLWLILSALAYFYLPGASYFVLPAIFGMFSLISLVLFKTNSQFLHFLFSLPLLFTILPFIYFLPVGLGMSSIFISCVLCVLVLLLLSPILANFHALKGMSFLVFCTALFFLGKAHINSGFNVSQPRPTSLVYCEDKDKQESFWASYDLELSRWNANYFQKDEATEEAITFESKYANRFQFVGKAETIEIPISTYQIEKLDQTTSTRTYKLKLTPNRNLNRYEAFFNRPIEISNVVINGKPLDINFKEKYTSRNTRFFNYYVSNQEALSIEFTVLTTEDFELKLYESAFDLINHPELKVPARPSNQISTPFVLNDATIAVHKLSFYE